MKPSKICFGILFLIMACSSINAQEKSHRHLSDTIDVSSYELNLDLREMSDNYISGRTILWVKSKVSGLEHINLELKQLICDSVFAGGMVVNDFQQYSDRLDIPLEEALNPGDSIQLDIYYQGYPYHESWGGFHFSGSYCFNLGVGISEIPHNLGKSWFPCLDDFHDRAIYSYNIRLADDLTAVCGGHLDSVTQHADNSHTFHWNMDNSIPTYLASVAAGPYAHVQDTYEGINGTIPIDFYVEASDTANIAGSFVHLKEILTAYEAWFGPYPWLKVGYVGTALGAMEHASNIAYPSFCINGSLTNESLYAHELSHMWLGDMATCASAYDMWLNEGWAVYCESLYRYALYGEESFWQNINDLHAEVLQYCHTPAGDGDYYAIYGIPQNITYGTTVYDKGATVVHTLRNYMGDDVFFDFIKEYLQAFKYSFADSWDMRDFISQYTGTDMTSFFDCWVFQAGFPHFSIDSMTISPSGSDFLTEVFMRQKLKGKNQYADHNRIEVLFMDKDWNQHTEIIEFSGMTGSQSLNLPFEAVTASVDPGHKICDATTDDAAIIKSPGEHNFNNCFVNIDINSIEDSTYMRVTHNWVAPDSLDEPVTGLRLSDYRYWSVEVLHPEKLSASASFLYSRNNYLDNNLILSQSDSVVMLYRHSAAEDWQLIPFTQSGIWMLGYIHINELQPGDYALGVFDTQVGTENDPVDDETFISIYPNPAKSYVYIESNTKEAARIKVFTHGGRLVKDVRLDKGRWPLKLDVDGLRQGLYYLQMFNKDKEVITGSKLLIKN